MSKSENVLVFDLDGVITSEHAYWQTAALVVHELLYSPTYWHLGNVSTYEPAQTHEEIRHIQALIFSQEQMLSLKNRGINSNWDTCFVGVVLSLVELLAAISRQETEQRLPSDLLPFAPWDADWQESLRKHVALNGLLTIRSPFVALERAPLAGAFGYEIFPALEAYAGERLRIRLDGIFQHGGDFWCFCQNLFQEWYFGDELYAQEYQHLPRQSGKVGCIQFEQPQIPIPEIKATLTHLREQGYTLTVATGRPQIEAIWPLKQYGLFDLFDADRFVTYADVVQAEQASGRTALGKPHPYSFLRAYDASYEPGKLLPPPNRFIVIGDTPSDIQGARAAGALVVVVLTGALTMEKLAGLPLEQQPDGIAADVSELPAVLKQFNDLLAIQKMQIRETRKAERLLQHWFVHEMEMVAEKVTLTPKAVSLNSFNGFLVTEGEEYFFKTHVEDKGILEEYYHAEMLADIGYNVVRPVKLLHQQGRQMVIYPVIRDPDIFTLIRPHDRGEESPVTAATLIAAEERECKHLLHVYEQSIQVSSAEEHAKAPVHQLFWHRLAGERLQSFYAGKSFLLPEGSVSDEGKSVLSFEELLTYRWVVNGQAAEFVGQSSLGELIELGKKVLDPERASVTVVGHGDAHFGNVFLQDRQRYLYFDPAFAGRHSPFLDVVKPMFHNVFAMWLYFTPQIEAELDLSLEIHQKTIYLQHTYDLPAIRQALLETKIRNLLIPTVNWLRERGQLPDDWFDVLRLALMCCPLLTMNLSDRERFPDKVRWLGLSQAMQMGTLTFGIDLAELGIAEGSL